MVSLEAQTSELVVDVQHVLKGVLAQFGRGAVVDAVIDGMLGRFAGELGRAAAGESLEAAPIAPRRSWLASWLATLARALRGRRD